MTRQMYDIYPRVGEPIEECIERMEYLLRRGVRPENIQIVKTTLEFSKQELERRRASEPATDRNDLAPKPHVW